jgi:hypothetical protein
MLARISIDDLQPNPQVETSTLFPKIPIELRRRLGSTLSPNLKSLESDISMTGPHEIQTNGMLAMKSRISTKNIALPTILVLLPE